MVSPEVLHTIKALQEQIDALEARVDDGAVMVPLYVHLPHAVYQRLRERSEEMGQPAMELASLWLWRAVREF